MDDEITELIPPEEVTKEVFAEWRSPRRGAANPERLDNPVWQWLFESKWTAFAATDHFQEETAYELGPGWCHSRFGQSETDLGDGRTVFLAGEHEDFYDPDFFIYNDVTIRHCDGSLEFFGYPVDDFPPTDFHSATLLEDGILLIGNLGYIADRRPGETQVLKLDTKTWKMVKVETGGDCPGWISDHTARLSPDGKSITASGGRVFLESGQLVESFDDWKLDLGEMQWSRLTDRKWTMVEIAPKGDEWLKLYEMRHALEMEEFDYGDEVRDLMAGSGLEVEDEDLTWKPPKDRETFAVLYVPPVEHEHVENEDEEDYRNFRIRIDGVIVRYTEESDAVTLTVEGQLPPEVVDDLIADLMRKLEIVCETEMETIRVC